MNSMQAVREMALIKYFPAGPGEREAVMNLLDKLAAGNEERLQWLVDIVVNYVGEWPGPAQLRALYATRYRPADGIEGTHCTIAGFTPMDLERASLEAHENVKQLERLERRLENETGNQNLRTGTRRLN